MLGVVKVEEQTEKKFAMNKITAIHMLVLFVIISILDYISTVLVINVGGIEVNRLAAIAFESSNPALYGLGYKLLTIVLVFGLYTIFKRIDKQKSFARILLLVNIALTLAVTNNFWWVYYMNTTLYF